MMCQSCNDQNASIHVLEIVDQKNKEFHLCDECAKQKGVTLKTNVTLPELLGSLAETPWGKEAQKLAKKCCPSCGINYLEFRHGGRLGCPNDYDYFEKELVPLLERIHGGTSNHIGKVPARAGDATKRASEALKIEVELRKAIGEEDYEAAAKLRDQLKKLREGSVGDP